MSYRHQVKNEHGQVFSVTTPTHVDDHASQQSWFNAHIDEIRAAAMVAGVVLQGVALYLHHKPPRVPR